MKKIDMTLIANFAALCIALGKKEEDYNVEAASTNAQKAFVYLSRLKLIAKGYNGNKKVNMADIKHRKYYAWVYYNPDSEGLAGFRLSFDGYGYDDSNADLGARPYFLDSGDVEPAFEQWKSEFEGFAQYEALSLMED